MERTYINSLFNHTRSLPLEVSLDQATEWVNIQARTPAGKSNSWFNFLNSIIMVGIIIAIGAFCLTPSLTQPQTAAQLLTPKSTLEVPLHSSSLTFAMLKQEHQVEKTLPVANAEATIHSQLLKKEELPQPPSKEAEVVNTNLPFASTSKQPNIDTDKSGVIEPSLESFEVYAASENFEHSTPCNESTPCESAAVVSNHQVSFFADGHTGDWNNSVQTAQENGVKINACQLKRNKKGVVKKLDMSVLVKRPEANYSYRGFLRINTKKFERIDFAWDLLEDGSVSNFRYSMDGGEFEEVENVYRSCSRVKRRVN